MLYDHCVFSRFDAYMGVANATIRNSTLGQMVIHSIGSGMLTIENSTIHGSIHVNPTAYSLQRWGKLSIYTTDAGLQLITIR